MLRQADQAIRQECLKAHRAEQAEATETAAYEKMLNEIDPRLSKHSQAIIKFKKVAFFFSFQLWSFYFPQIDLKF